MNSLGLLSMAALLALGTGCAQATSEDSAAADNAITDDTTSAGRAAVGALVEADGTAHCTGTLVASNVVLTGADCVTARSSLTFVLGDARFAAARSDDGAHPYAHVHPDFAGERHNLAYVILAASVPASVARPARIGSHTNAADCAFDVQAGDGAGVKTAGVCLTGTQPSTGLLTATESDGSTCIGEGGAGLLLRGSSGNVLVGVVGGAKPCAGAEMLFTPLASESAFVQQAIAAGSRARGSVSFD